MSAPLVEVVRGGIVDAIHRGDLAVVDADGTLLASVGDPRGRLVWWRSAAKPFQALPLLSSGAAERWGFTPAEVALASGSHNGEPAHVAHAAAMLAKVGADVAHLVCPAHPPLDPQAAAELLRGGGVPSALHSNCSGNHIGMLALAEHLGGGRAGYQSPEHPAQVAIVDAIGAFAGVEPDAVAIGTDGCGTPSYATSVHHLALAFARLMRPVGVSEPDASAAEGVRAAMAANPYEVAGRERIDTELMEAGPPGLIAKSGAGGVQCVGLPGGRAVAVKIDDGASGPAAAPGAVAAIAALRQLGVLDDAQVAALATHARPPVRTLAGQVVGEARPIFQLRPRG